MKIIEGFLAKAIELLTLGQMNKVVKDAIRKSESDPDLKQKLTDLQKANAELRRHYDEFLSKHPHLPMTKIVKKQLGIKD